MKHHQGREVAAKDLDIIKEAKECFGYCVDNEAENRQMALDDLRFALLSEQWPEEIKRQREDERRPCLTINRCKSFIRQVVNDSRQNQEQAKCHPVDSKADPQTAEVYNGLIKNIEYISDADTAFDTALESAVVGGFGYVRVDIDYAHDDTFDLDILVNRVSNPFQIYGDYRSTDCDSSDWMEAFVVNRLTKDDFKKKYKGAQSEKATWDSEGYDEEDNDWISAEFIRVAEYWKREETDRIIVKLNDGTIMDADVYKEQQDIFQMIGLDVVADRRTKGYKVTQRIMTGTEVLETNDWKGKYIPIVPAYGEEINVEGKRYFWSLVRDIKDPQRMVNYWRTTSTELVALSPKTPFIGPVGAFTTAQNKWATANTESHAYIEYDGPVPPQRQPFASVPGGALQEALNASDDMKSIIGIYDAALGARSNETSGVAINARQRESDVSTFHYIDNLRRCRRHVGRILIDLIPHIYTGERIIRTLGGDDGKKPMNVQLGQEQQRDEQGNLTVYNLGVGKYDLTVETGPSYTTQREETSAQLTELLRAFPQAAPIIGDLYVKNLDIIGAEEVSRRLEAMLPPQLKGEEGQDPEKMQLKQMLQQMQQQLHDLQQKTAIEAEKVKIDAYDAETNRLKVMGTAMQPDQVQALVMQTLQQVLSSPDVLTMPQPKPQQQPNPMASRPMAPSQTTPGGVNPQ